MFVKQDIDLKRKNPERSV